MADIKAVVVTFDTSINDEDIERYIQALYTMRHVIDVRPVSDTWEDESNRARVRFELRQKLLQVLKD